MANNLQQAYRSYGGTMIDLEKRQNKTKTVAAAYKDIGGAVGKIEDALTARSVHKGNLESGRKLLEDTNEIEKSDIKKDISPRTWNPNTWFNQGGVQIGDQLYSDKQVAELGALAKSGKGLGEDDNIVVDSWKKVMVGKSAKGYQDRPELNQIKRDKWEAGIQKWEDKMTDDEGFLRRKNDRWQIGSEKGLDVSTLEAPKKIWDFAKDSIASGVDNIRDINFNTMDYGHSGRSFNDWFSNSWLFGESDMLGNDREGRLR